MLMPNRWNEPFGLTIIESMAAGTPVIGTDLGSIPEIIIDNVTGYVINTNNGKTLEDRREIVSDMSHAVDRLSTIKGSARNCRKHVETNFDRMRMARDYIQFYRDIID